MSDATPLTVPTAPGRTRLEALPVVAVALLAVVAAASLFNPLDLRWSAPTAFAAMGAVGALVLMAASVITMAIADRRDMGELGLIGNGLLSMAILMAAHAAVTPDALYDGNDAFGLAALLVAPAFVLSALPVLFASTRFGRWGARNWRDWSLLSTLGAFVVAFLLTGLPDIWRAPAPRHAVSIVVSVSSMIAILVLAARMRARCAATASRTLRLMGSALAVLAVASIAPMADVYSVGFWGLRGVGLLAAMTLAITAGALANGAARTQEAFAPVLRVDPFLGLDLVVNPLVQRHLLVGADGVEFADTADLALKVADRMGLSIAQRRHVGLAAVMHDVGKMLVPAEILRKPGALSEAEFGVVQQHAADGAEMLARDPRLASCAQIVRSHHERFDGAGYPDGLAGHEIPVEARIIAVCDAFQAITHDRDYRAGLPVGLSLAILRTNAGQQWDADVVRHLMLVVADLGLVGPTPQVDIEIPDDLGDLLNQVDCEI